MNEKVSKRDFNISHFEIVNVEVKEEPLGNDEETSVQTEDTHLGSIKEEAEEEYENLNGLINCADDVAETLRNSNLYNNDPLAFGDEELGGGQLNEKVSEEISSLEYTLGSNLKSNEEYEEKKIILSATDMSERKAEKIYRCLFCEFVTKYRSSLKNHVLTHSNLKLYKCPDCDYECNQKVHLKTHLLTHQNIKLFKCPECTYESNRKDTFKAHLLTHSNTKLFRCSECNFECRYKRNLKAHSLTHATKKRFHCPHCNYECNRKDNLSRHLLTHAEKKLFQCPECNFANNDKYNLKSHIFSKHIRHKSDSNKSDKSS